MIENTVQSSLMEAARRWVMLSGELVVAQREKRDAQELEAAVAEAWRALEALRKAAGIS